MKAGAPWAAAAALAAAASAADAGDANAGKEIYERCAACHSLSDDRAGPRHCGVLGRRAGSVQGFAYSDAMKRSGIVWTEKELERFLASPMSAVPGTSMGYSGIGDRKERADLIAYLRQAGSSRECGKVE